MLIMFRLRGLAVWRALHYCRRTMPIDKLRQRTLVRNGVAKTLPFAKNICGNLFFSRDGHSSRAKKYKTRESRPDGERDSRKHASQTLLRWCTWNQEVMQKKEIKCCSRSRYIEARRKVFGFIEATIRNKARKKVKSCERREWFWEVEGGVRNELRDMWLTWVLPWKEEEGKCLHFLNLNIQRWR